MPNDSNETHRDFELRIRTVENSMATLTQIASRLSDNDDDKEVRLRAIEQKYVGTSQQNTGVITPERIIWGLICIIAYLLKIPGFLN